MVRHPGTSWSGSLHYARQRGGWWTWDLQSCQEWRRNGLLGTATARRLRSREEGGVRVNTVGLFPLLPSSFLQVSLISQIYPKLERFLVHRKRETGFGRERDGQRKRPSAGRGNVQRHQEEQAFSSIRLPLELVVNSLMLSTA